jgi:hypothetical protein
MGDVKFYNFKAADNARVDLEMTFPDYYGENKAMIDGALVIGKSSNFDPNPDNDEKLRTSSPRGVEMAAREYFNVKNVRFFNFDFNDAAAIGTCSHCTQPEDKGARTARTEKLWFDDETVPRRITYNFPGKGIIHDLDGTLTDKGPGSWATAYFKHHEWSGCENLSDTKYRGTICDSSVAVRKLTFSGMAPSHRFKNQGLRLLRYDDVLMLSQNREKYLENIDNYSSMPFQAKGSPSNGWSIPFITGHKYKIHWGNVGLDFDQMTIGISERWTPED